jgi:hypothetical protein
MGTWRMHGVAVARPTDGAGQPRWAGEPAMELVVPEEGVWSGSGGVGVEEI